MLLLSYYYYDYYYYKKYNNNNNKGLDSSEESTQVIEFRLINDQIETKIAEIIEWENLRILLKNKIKLSHEKSQNRIKFEVGGIEFGSLKYYSINKELLLSIKDTYFYVLISNSENFKRQDNGSFLIKRDNLLFDRILNYFRTGIIIIITIMYFIFIVIISIL